MRGGRVFISYRRDDSRADSGRLYDRLSASFPGRVFRDVGSIEPGVEWDEAIARVLSQSDACIVVIGKDWLNITDAAGIRRLDDPRDTVRQEIAAVLKRQMRVFPVLVGGARMPTEGNLPADLQALCRRNAIELPEQHWDEAVQKLIKALETAFVPSAEPRASAPPSPRRAWVLPASAILAVAIIAALYLALRRSNAGANAGSVPAPNAAFQFAGNWRAVVITAGQRADEELNAYPDQSFRLVAQNSTTGIGRWQYNPAADSLELSDGTNLTNNARFSCSWKNVSAAPEGLSGTCIDRAQNAWTISLSRGPGRAVERYYNVPRVDLSSLSTAEKAAFTELLAREQCGCRMKMLVCLRTHPACPYSAGLSQTALASFLRTVRP
ncbi:MAG: toll/interleukin-1 receptor domain-containing protein [Bryobacteraceae bacterium]|jgi:hypothetical protein